MENKVEQFADLVFKLAILYLFNWLINVSIYSYLLIIYYLLIICIYLLVHHQNRDHKPAPAMLKVYILMNWIAKLSPGGRKISYLESLLSAIVDL